MSAVVKNWAISRAAFSWLSEPCTEFSPTNPANADEGTIRKLYAESVGENSVHGSDSQDNAKLEIAQFFTEADIVG